MRTKGFMFTCFKNDPLHATLPLFIVFSEDLIRLKKLSRKGIYGHNIEKIIPFDKNRLSKLTSETVSLAKHKYFVLIFLIEKKVEEIQPVFS